jgi:hypothetical protein
LTAVCDTAYDVKVWIPACAGMTEVLKGISVIPAQAGIQKIESGAMLGTLIKTKKD